jgi:Protein of unknown function (DUF1153)
MATERAPINHAVPHETVQSVVKHVIGPDGRRLTLADLPLPDTKRWVIRRKAEVVAAVRGGLLSLEDAYSRYALNPDELLSWQHCIDHFGLAGLRTTRTQFYHSSPRQCKGSLDRIPDDLKRAILKYALCDGSGTFRLTVR